MQFLGWLLILLISITGLLFLLYAGAAIWLRRGARTAEVQNGSTIYAARNQNALHLLDETMGTVPYLTPSQAEDVLRRGHGDIVRLRSGTRVLFKGALNDQGQTIEHFDYEQRDRWATLRIQVLDGSLAHSNLLLPKNYYWAVRFAGREAFP